jgi:anti-anti-sigma factor
MAAPSPTLLVAANQKVALVKISGRASFNSSVEFKNLVYGLREQGRRRFVLDLTDCLILDSTFLGVLAGFALKLTEPSERRATITLLNPNARILDLLENLGVAHLFQVIQGSDPLSQECKEVQTPGDGPDKLEASRTCLEAHETLMAINSANIPKFKDVARFMAEDLKKLEARKQ